MLSRYTALALLLLAAPALATAQEVDLSPKYEKGNSFVFDAEVASEQTLTLAGMNIETGATVFEKRSLEILEASDTGHKLKLTTPKMQFDLSLPGGLSVSFDSENPDKKPDASFPGIDDLLNMLKVASKMELTADVNNEGKIDELSVAADGLDTLPEAMKSYLSTDRLKPQMEQEFKRYPSDKVKPGDTWTRSEIFDAGQGQYFSYTTNYKYEGQVEEAGKKYHKITCTFEKPKFDIEAGSALPITVKSSDLSMKGSSGMMLLDDQHHQISKFESKSVFKGKLVFNDPNGNEIPGELDLTVNVKLNRKAE